MRKVTIGDASLGLLINGRSHSTSRHDFCAEEKMAQILDQWRLRDFHFGKSKDEVAIIRRNAPKYRAHAEQKAQFYQLLKPW